jgi:hypothetical protein
VFCVQVQVFASQLVPAPQAAPPQRALLQFAVPEQPHVDVSQMKPLG